MEGWIGGRGLFYSNFPIIPTFQYFGKDYFLDKILIFNHQEI
jgi:hypothetical protein